MNSINLLVPCPRQISILFVDDSDDDVQLLAHAIGRDGFTVVSHRVATVNELCDAIDCGSYDLILADFHLNGFNGIDVLHVLRERAVDIPVIVVTGTVGEETAADAMRAGARDFVLKDRIARLGPAIRRELAEATTRRKARTAEAELQIEQERYRTLVERSAEVITVVDREGTIVYGSPTSDRLLGYPTAEFVGRSGFELVDPDDRAIARDGFAAVLDHPGHIERRVLRMRHKDGRRVWMEITATNLLDVAPIRGVVLNLRDVNERQTALEALQASEALYRGTFDEAPVGIIHTTLDGRVLRANREFARMLGYTAEEVLAMSVATFTPPEELAIDLAAAEQLVAGAVAAHSREMHYRRKDGTTTWAVRKVSVQRDAQGRPLHLTAVVADIDDRKKAERALNELQERFQAVLDYSPAVINLKDQYGRYVLGSRVFVEKYNVDGRSPIGRTADDIFPAPVAAALREHEAEVLATQRPVSRELEVAERDGAHTYISHKFLLRDERGGPAGIGCIGIDITDRKQIEQQFLQAQKMEAFGQLAGGIAHDFNNILAVLLMHFNLMPLQAELPTKTLSTLKDLEQVVSRATGLVRQLLIFSRKHELSKQVLDLNRSLEDVCRVLQRFVGEDIAFTFAPTAQPLWVDADSGMLEQVVMNLAVNARDAMPRGGALNVLLGCERRPMLDRSDGSPRDYAVITVADTGHGMDEATKRRIFEPFFTTKPAGRGTGLGLATVHSVAKQHNGWVDVDSTVGAGATFRVYLPMTDEKPRAISAMVEHWRRGSARVLLVEDDEQVRAAAASCLRLAGYRVVEATDAVEAETCFPGEVPFDVLLTDIVMPRGSNGLELAERLQRRKPSLKIVVMTGYSSVEPEKLSPIHAEFVRLTKPFSATKLLEVIAELQRRGEP